MLCNRSPTEISRQFANFALQCGDVGLFAGDRGLELGGAVKVLLVIAFVATALGLTLSRIVRRSPSRLRCALGSTLAVGLVLTPAGAGLPPLGRKDGTTVMGVPSMVLQPLSRASLALMASVYSTGLPGQR